MLTVQQRRNKLEAIRQHRLAMTTVNQRVREINNLIKALKEWGRSFKTPSARD